MENNHMVRYEDYIKMRKDFNVRKRFVFLLFAAILMFCVIGGSGHAREMKMPDRTIMEIPDELPDFMTLSFSEPRPVYIGEGFGLFAVFVVDGDVGYNMLFAVERFPSNPKAVISLIAIVTLRDGKVLKIYVDKRYFEVGFPDGKIVAVSDLPNLDKLIEMKTANSPFKKMGGKVHI